jgi:hypothetical protein
MEKIQHKSLQNMNISATFLCIKIPALVMEKEKCGTAFSTRLTLHKCFMLCANQRSDEMDTIHCLTCVVVCKAITSNWHT